MKEKFLKSLGIEKMIHPKTKAVHFVKDKKSISMVGLRNKNEKEAFEEAVFIMVSRIDSGSEQIPEGFCNDDLEEMVKDYVRPMLR